MTDDFEQTSVATFTRIRAGEARPAELAVQYLPRLRAYVHARLGRVLQQRETPTDIVQSVCRELCRSEERLDFEVEAEFRAWLFRAALNKIRERARFWKQQKRAGEREEELGEERSLDELTQGLSGIVTPSRVASAREQAERLEAALLELPEDYRDVIALSRIAGLSYAQVAEQMKRSEEASRKLLGRALRALAAAMDKGTSSSSSG